MSSFECPVCNTVYAYKDNLKRHMKKKHPERVNLEKIQISNQKVETMSPLVPYTCFKCGKVFANQHGLNKHLETEHTSKSYTYQCFVCLKPFYSKTELDYHVKNLHPPPAFSDASDMFPGMLGTSEEVCSQFVFEHPFSMIVAGPSRSGKTHWLINLLINKNVRIKPTPTSIIYCYSHWQSKYNELKKAIPYVNWIRGLPNKEFLNTISNAILVIDDLMDASVNDQNMMSIFTERSHHQNLSVILTMQNLFHQGAKSRSIQLNAQYMVLYKNPRDRQQIKTLALQMYPNKWRQFLEQFEYETSKPYGKIIIDLRPNTKEEDRIVKNDEDRIVKNDKDNSMVKYLEHMEQKQHQQMQYTNPYLAEAQEEQSNMKSILNDASLNEYEKQIKHAEALRNYQTYMSKANESQAKQPPPLLPLIPPIVPVKTSPVTPQQVAKLPDPGYVGTMEDILDIPYIPLVIDKHDYEEDDGDEEHMQHFVSLSDDEQTAAKKQQRAHYRFQQRVLEKRKKRDKKPY